MRHLSVFTIARTHRATLQPNVSSSCCVDGVLCSERSASEWRSLEAHVEVESSTSSLKWLAFMLHIVLEPEERAMPVQSTELFQQHTSPAQHSFPSATSLRVGTFENGENLILRCLYLHSKYCQEECATGLQARQIYDCSVDSQCGLRHSQFRSEYKSGHESGSSLHQAQ